MHIDMGEVDTETVRPKVTDANGILKQNREFLDYFWDIAKPEREIRLAAIENLVEHLKKSEKVLGRKSRVNILMSTLYYSLFSLTLVCCSL